MSILKWFRNDCCIYGFHTAYTLYIQYTYIVGKYEIYLY